MQILNNTEKFGKITILLHWVIAILIIGQLTLGTWMVRLPTSVQKLKFYGWHKEIGALILALVIVRIAWRLMNITPTLDNLPRFEKFSARSMHLLLYLLMVFIPITGWLLTSAAGLQVSFFGWFLLPNLMPSNETLQSFFGETHEWLGYILIAAICLHTAAALKHHFINKDDILRRML